MADANITVKRFRLTQARQVAAVEEPSDLSQLPSDHPWPEPFKDLFVIAAPTALSADLRKTVDLWLSPPDHPDAPQAIVLNLDSGTIRWRPGRAVLECAPANRETLLAALLGFAFFEGELRRLEQELLPFEASAAGDAALAYRIRQQTHAEWDRLGKTMENLSLLRLALAKLEPALATFSRTLDAESRYASARLSARAGIPARLESLSARLEACEDLYEGAVDRVTDFRWYRKGEILETVIVVLLVLEVILMAWQLLLHR
jgi:hypothetical protein